MQGVFLQSRTLDRGQQIWRGITKASNEVSNIVMANTIYIFSGWEWWSAASGNVYILQLEAGLRQRRVWRFFGFKIQTCEFTKISIYERSKCIEYLIESIEIYLIFRNIEFIELLNS